MIQQIIEEPESRRSKLLNTFKMAGEKDSRITNYKFWQPNNHAIELDPFKPKIMDQKSTIFIIIRSKSELFCFPEEYLFSSARDYAEIKGLVKIEIL
ncbi:MAG: hypothetical protein IPL74_08150 [Bacteroidetes bacterium]|nr:hypothetical protein [Bacteroidota bacterium]